MGNNLMYITEIFLATVNRGITAGIVILAVLLARELLVRLRVPRRYIYLLWLIPALRLLCPVTLSSVTSLFNLPVFDRAVQTEAGLTYLPEELTALTQTGEQTEGVRSGSYGMGTVRQDIGEAANYYGGHAFELPLQRLNQAGSPDNSKAIVEDSVPIDLRPMALQGLAGVWLAGVILLACRQLYAYGKVCRQVACAVRLPDEIGGNIYECENIRSPFTMGPIHARIYIPCQMERREREYVLLHERYHIRCHDLWARLLACALQVFYWYNPLIWVGGRCMERDMEMRCDEHVLEQMGENIRYDYSLSLLSYAAGRRYHPMDVTAFGESGTGKRVNHVLKYRKTSICIAILAVTAILAVAVVCLTDRKPDGENLPEDKATPVEKTYFWGQQEMKIDFPKENVTPSMSLAGRSLIPLTLETEAGIYENTYSCVGGHCFFMVHSYYGDNITTYELQVFDGDRKEWSSGLVDMGLLDKGYIYDIFAVSAQELVYLVLTRNEDREYESYYAVHMSREGEELKRVDLLPACLELDMVQQQVLPTEICVDSQGNYYMISFDGKKMAILDSEGKTVASRDSSIRYKRVVPWITAGPDGGILTQGYNEENGMEWLWLDGTREKSLGTAGGMSFTDRLIPLDNGLYYYITGDKVIYQGNGDTGILEYLFDAGNILGNWGEVAVNGEGEILLFVRKEDSSVAYVLNRAGQTRMGEGGQSIDGANPLHATCISTFSWNQDLESTLPVFMADHPEYAFDLKAVAEADRAAAHDRVWNELIAGGGPDLLYIDEEDLVALWEKGVLMDLRELLSQETLDMIYPGLLDTGTIDGSLAGVSIFYNFRSLVTDRNIWSKEEWSVEEVVTLLETGNYPHAVHRGWRYSGPESLMHLLVYGDLEHTPFIDWEAGICAFDSDLFVRLLKAVKQYQSDEYAEVEAPDEYMSCFQELLDGNCLAVEDTVVDRSGFVYSKQFLGERYNRPGIPGANGSRQVVDPVGFYVVNKNCKNKEAAAAYLEFLLGTRYMADYRKDCRDSFQVGKDWEGKWAISQQVNGMYGLSYLLDTKDPALFDEEMPQVYVEYLEYCEEYYDFMEALEGQPPTDERLITIIEEEAKNFFEGTHSAEDVAKVIQKRVQLYLNERQ